MKRRDQSAGRKTVRIVIVDDSIGFREALATLCAVLPRIKIVGQAENGVEGLAAIRRHQPDVVMLDLHMPRKGGLEVLETIKQDALDCMVIVLSAMIDELLRRKCLELGAGFVFDKTTEFAAVRQLLGKL
jgi:DNA-binding NarL/FixJ family response regulator